MRACRLPQWMIFGCSVSLITSAAADDKSPVAQKQPDRPAAAVLSKETRNQASAAMDAALTFLKSTRTEVGAWENMGRPDPAITALVTKCFIQHPAYGPDHPIVKQALDYVLSFKQPDGGIYAPGTGMRNYYTCVCLMALSSSQSDRYERPIKDAQNFLKNLQWDGTEDIDEANTWYGGAGYGKHKRPDLSNTQMMLEALKQSGLPSSDPTYKKALKFIERCQMSSASNDQPFARGVDEGGFIYTPANGGESKAGTVIVDGQQRLRSYGSMTYAGFKSYIYADLSHDDPRVQGAFNWIRAHYTLDSNPNLPDKQSLEGLYYFYHVFSLALEAWGEPVITDTQGVKHNWREDLCKKLKSLQNKDGSWVNEADRWYEGNPQLATAYAVLALQNALK